MKAATKLPYWRWDENEDDLVRLDCDCTLGRYIEIGTRDYAERWEIVEFCERHNRERMVAHWNRQFEDS